MDPVSGQSPGEAGGCGDLKKATLNVSPWGMEDVVFLKYLNPLTAFKIKYRERSLYLTMAVVS